MAYLEIRKLSKKYDRAADYVIKELDLSVEKGEFVTLLGRSGCGKTTLLRLLCGFEPHSEGEIILNGKVISSQSIWIPPEKRNIGMVFQDYALFPNMTAWENVAFSIRREQDCDERTDDMLRLMDIYDIKDKHPHQLSGGQQQRTAIARALIRQPDILLMDEPFSNLDLEIRETVRKEIQKILNRIEATVILVTHDQLEALSISHKIAILHEGRIQQIASPYEIYNNPANLFVAEFIGKANVFTGVVEDANRIFCDIGVVASQLKLPYEKGNPVKLIIRPEDVIISEEGNMKGVIVDYNYMGAYYGASISVSTRNDTGLLLHALLPGKTVIGLGYEIKFDIYIKSLQRVFQEA